MPSRSPKTSHPKHTAVPSSWPCSTASVSKGSPREMQANSRALEASFQRSWKKTLAALCVPWWRPASLAQIVLLSKKLHLDSKLLIQLLWLTPLSTLACGGWNVSPDCRQGKWTGLYTVISHIKLLCSFADFSFTCKVVGSDGVTKHIHNASKIRLMAWWHPSKGWEIEYLTHLWMC